MLPNPPTIDDSLVPDSSPRKGDASPYHPDRRGLKIRGTVMGLL